MEGAHGGTEGIAWLVSSGCKVLAADAGMQEACRVRGCSLPSACIVVRGAGRCLNGADGAMCLFLVYSITGAPIEPPTAPRRFDRNRGD